MPALKGYRDFRNIRQDQGIQVYTCIEDATGNECIVKEFDFDEDTVDLDSLSKEVLFLRSCRSPNIIECYGAHLDTESCTLYLVLEPLLCSVSDVQGQEGLCEASVAYIIHEVLLALVYLHSEHKVHRDVKALNIFLSRHGNVKLSEFGVASRVTGTSVNRCKTYVGTPLWMAPEVIHQNPEVGEQEKGSGYDESADIWSLGITAIEIASGQVPRAHVPAMRLLFAIVEEPPPELDSSFSPEFRDFVSLCLQKNPQDRPSAIDLLLHPFLKNANITQEILDRISACTEQGEEEDDEAMPEDVDTASAPHPPKAVLRDDGDEKEKDEDRKTEDENVWTKLVSIIDKDRDADLVNILTERSLKGDVLHLGTLGEYLMKSTQYDKK